MADQKSVQVPSKITPATKNEPATFLDAVGAVLTTAFPSTKTLMQLTQLSTAAGALNSLSDELTKQVSEIEATLNAFNLGVRAEVVAKTLDHGEYYSHWLRLAYGKESGKWGFIVEELEEDRRAPEDESYQSWAFRDAPREFRIEVVDKIPDLLEALVKKSNETTEVVAKKVKYVQELASILAKPGQQAPRK